MQLVRTEMCVPPRHRQTLVSQQIRDIFERGSLHSQPARKRVPQIVPVKILGLRCDYRIVKAVTAVFERLAGLGRREDPSFSIPLFEDSLERTDSRIV